MLAAYCWPASGQAGDSIDLMVSAELECDVEVARVGSETEQVLRIDGLAATIQATPDDVAVQGCRWAATTTITVNPSWSSGFYLVRLTDRSGATADAFFVVKANPERDPAGALLVLSTTTWAAYNDWGGPSFYTGGHRSSMLRPLPNGFLDKPDPDRYRAARMISIDRDERRTHFADYSPWAVAAGWAGWERRFVTWAEQEGYRLDYATSLDLADDPSLLTPYHTYLSVGHDEYWSASMRDHVEGWVDEGGRALFFSGNTAFWQVRLEQDGTQVVGYKIDIDQDPVAGTSADHTTSTMWSDPLCRRPENEMTGVSFTRGGYANIINSPAGGGYEIWQPKHWVFDGLDLDQGDQLGAASLVVGYECDGCHLEMIDGRPHPVGDDGTPPNFEILGTAPAKLWETHEVAPGLDDSFVGELNWVAERLGGADTVENRDRYRAGHAVLGCFERGKGFVFTTGCTDWAYGLDEPEVATVTRNLLRHSQPGSVDRKRQN